ncbi:AAA family ATPase [Neobacillus niacini]|uniref:AAA family ATPase n=1 Tax=Neobacillus niacini TaxID=86668 RepID=UPI001C8D5CC6|nr:SbcC/MukB-like Walker B domain-containing protein [Neobacillus niacini]MBY0147173.1 AAA family ATPase [Neobacillus niacini]
MRPLKITITAFGPYRDCEVIDFTELKDNRLFVVSGNTGAGKTTIFDAICFALYGSASGEDRSDSKMMRSDFASDEVHTSVELEFELHDKQYRIRRQLPHVKKGNKGATGEQYEFYKKTKDGEIPCVDRQIVSEINKKVEEIVGLTQDQFSQIVMLPQGEFRKLLTSQTENKEEILRKIFKTEPYKWISERLRDRKKAADEEYKREASMIERYIKDIQATLPIREESKLSEVLSQNHYNTNQIIEGLDEETEFYLAEMMGNKKVAEEAETLYNQKLEEYHQSKTLNERFFELEEKEAKLQNASYLVPSFKEKEVQFEKAERASKIIAYENQVNEWRTDEKAKKQALDEAKSALERAMVQREKAQNNYVIEEQRKGEREESVRTVDRLNEYLPTVQEIDSRKSELLKIDQGVQKLAKDLEAYSLMITSKNSEKERLSTDIKHIEKIIDELPAKQEALLELREQAGVIKEYLKYYQSQMKLQQDYSVTHKDYLSMKVRYERLEESWISGQASILAMHLHDGKPCPVCGSPEHPHKADGQDTVPTKEALEALKKEYDHSNNLYRDAAARLKTNKEHLEAKAKEVTAKGYKVEDAQSIYDRIVIEGQELRKEVEGLAAEKEKLTSLKTSLETTENELKQIETKREQLSSVHQEQVNVFVREKAIYHEKVGRIPEEIRNLAALKGKITEAQNRKEKLERDWDTAQKQLQNTKEAETKASTYYSSAHSQLQESTGKKERSETQFRTECQNAQFVSEEDYLRAKMTDSARKLLKESIDEFNKSIETLKLQIIELKEELKDKTKADLDGMTTELTNKKNERDFALKALSDSEGNQLKALDLRKKIINAVETTAILEEKMNMITDLYDVVRGQNGSKISFERYLQIEYLEEIIIAANERLKRLSNGQFILERSERQEARGRQSGLGLDVFDAYTGQTRDVKTLSGGEKFNASLCLALGMADVIQSFQGGVSIDTMFIDEGFGSLDEESLNKAIDTLIDLQESGRMIGVISHVQELKNAIPAILEVKKTKEGYSRTEFVIK